MSYINFKLLILLAILLSNCKENNKSLIKPIYDANRRYIGDSIFINNYLHKIVFNDNAFEIDSIVILRFTDNPTMIESILTYKKGKNIFQNIQYFENGNIYKYKFIDEDNSNCYYERIYSSDGKLNRINGNIFFKGYIIDTISKDINFIKGSTTSYRVYYPNPPDCKVKMYVQDSVVKLYDVFTKSNYLDFLETVYQDHKKEGIYKSNFLLEFEDNSNHKISKFSNSIIYKVISP